MTTWDWWFSYSLSLIPRPSTRQPGNEAITVSSSAWHHRKLNFLHKTWNRQLAV